MDHETAARYMKTGDIARAYRIHMGLSQGELAERLQVSRRTYQRLEEGWVPERPSRWYNVLLTMIADSPLPPANIERSQPELQPLPDLDPIIARLVTQRLQCNQVLYMCLQRRKALDKAIMERRQDIERTTER